MPAVVSVQATRSTECSRKTRQRRGRPEAEAVAVEMPVAAPATASAVYGTRSSSGSCRTSRRGRRCARACSPRGGATVGLHEPPRHPQAVPLRRRRRHQHRPSPDRAEFVKNLLHWRRQLAPLDSLRLCWSHEARDGNANSWIAYAVRHGAEEIELSGEHHVCTRRQSTRASLLLAKTSSRRLASGS